jgi:hypothetical protein
VREGFTLSHHMGPTVINGEVAQLEIHHGNFHSGREVYMTMYVEKLN